MHKIMAELHQDHKNLIKVMNVMEQQAESLLEGEDLNLSILLDAANYIQHYPDLIHHPRENQVFEVFVNRSSDAADVVEQLLSEHHELPSATIKFQTMLDGVVNGSLFVSRQELVDDIKQFIEMERKHMNLEEGLLFPIINKTLTEGDWDELNSKMEENNDPLFSGQIEEIYQNLYRLIDN